MSELSEMDSHASEMVEHIHDNMEFDNDFMEKYVDDFEAKLAKSKSKPKKKGLELLEEDDE